MNGNISGYLNMLTSDDKSGIKVTVHSNIYREWLAMKRQTVHYGCR